MNEYQGGERRSYDSTARQMADDARTRADSAGKDVAVIAARLEDHLTACEKSNDEIKDALKTMRRLMWGLLLSVLAGSGLLAVIGRGFGG